MTSNVTVDWHFAVPIFKGEFDDFAAHRDGLRDLVRTLMNMQEGLKRSNLNGWHSENNFHMQKNEHVSWLNAEIGKFAGACLSEFHQDSLAETEVLLTSCWANVSGVGGWNAPHNHLPCKWSGVFYLDVDESLKDNEPGERHGLIDFMNPLPLGRVYHRPSVQTYRPKDGLAFLFPSYLMHMVHPNLVDTLRMSIAFNLETQQTAKPGGVAY